MTHVPAHRSIGGFFVGLIEHTAFVVVGFVLDPDGYLIEIIQHDGKRPGE